MIPGLPDGLPDDVRQFCEAHPEITGIVVRAKLEKWPAQRLLDALKASDYYAEVTKLEKEWRKGWLT